MVIPNSLALYSAVACTGCATMALSLTRGPLLGRPILVPVVGVIPAIMLFRGRESWDDTPTSRRLPRQWAGGVDCVGENRLAGLLRPWHDQRDARSVDGGVLAALYGSAIDGPFVETGRADLYWDWRSGVWSSGVFIAEVGVCESASRTW